MKSIAVAGCGLVLGLALVGCGGSDQPQGSTVTGTGGASGGTGGTGFDPIGSGGGGTSGGGGHAGASAGSSGLGGAPGTPGYPSGPVTFCFGEGCPKGECDNELFFADTACSALFTTDAGPDFPYCNAGENGSYCLEAGTGFVNPDYSVTCASGKATVLMCANGCGNFGTAPSQCD